MKAACALDCGGKRQRDTAFGWDFGRAFTSQPKYCGALRASEGGVALTLPAAVQGCARYAGISSATIAFSSFSSFTVASIFERLKSFTGTPCTISQSPGVGTRIGKLQMSPFSIP